MLLSCLTSTIGHEASSALCKLTHTAICACFILRSHGTGGEELHHFRLLQRRFIVYRPTKAAGQSCASPGDSSHPSTQSAHLFPVAGSTQAGCATSAAPAASVLVGELSLHCTTHPGVLSIYRCCAHAAC